MKVGALVLVYALAIGVPSALAWPGRPANSPPKPPNPGAPPPAWIETQAGSTWLGFSSYCWTTGRTGTCADAIAPKCGQAGVPDIPVAGDETVRAHLGYTPIGASVDNAKAKLDGRIVTWRVTERGPFLLFTKGKGRDASYVGCAVSR